MPLFEDLAWVNLFLKDAADINFKLYFHFLEKKRLAARKKDSSGNLTKTCLNPQLVDS